MNLLPHSDLISNISFCDEEDYRVLFDDFHFLQTIFYCEDASSVYPYR